MSTGTQISTRQTEGALAETKPVSEDHERFLQTLGMVREAMLNPDVDADKAKIMMELMTSLEDRNMLAQFNRDFNAAVQNMPVITKDGKIVIAKQGEPTRIQGRFARYEDIDRVVRPIAARFNLSYTFEVDHNEKGMITVRPIITHANGHEKRGGAMPLPMDTSGGKNNVQGSGSAVTYGKRYTLCAAFNIVTEGMDDDGNLAKFADLPHERRDLVDTGAAAAHEAGTYGEFYSKQSPRDRAYLVASGLHAEYGGTAASLPAPADTPAPPPSPPPSAPPRNEAQKRSPRDMVEAYKSRVFACETLADLQALQSDAQVAKFIEGLRSKEPALHGEVIEANAKRYAALSTPGQTEGDDLFGENGK